MVSQLPLHVAQPTADDAVEPTPSPAVDQAEKQEFGGRKGPEPTRFGDWEKNGRCIDF